MNIDEIKEAKSKLQDDLAKMVQSFEDSTGLVVRSIDTRTAYRIGQNPRTQDVTVTVELP
jgi:hypothetical protein